MELKQGFPHARLRQTLQVSAVESVQGALWIGQSLGQVEVVPSIVLERLVEFRIHGLNLPFGGGLAEVGRNEKLRKTVQPLFKSLVGAIKVEVGVGQGGVSVVHATVVLHELSVFVLHRVLFRTLEEHVLKEMSGAVKWLRVEGAANAHVDGSSGLIGLWVRNEETPELVW